MRVLLVEDDLDMIELLGLLLQEMAGWEVSSYTSGQDVLDEPRSFAGQDLALIDLRMEPVTGPDLVRAMRGHGVLEYPIIFLSGQRPSDEELRLVDGYIQKPFTYEELMEQLRRQLGDRLSF